MAPALVREGHALQEQRVGRVELDLAPGSDLSMPGAKVGLLHTEPHCLCVIDHVLQAGSYASSMHDSTPAR